MNVNAGTAPIPMQVQTQIPTPVPAPAPAPIQMPQQKPAAPAMNVQPLTGIRRPGNIKSNVEEKTLSIPSFLQKK